MFASAEYGLRTMSMAGQLKKPHMTCSNLRPGASLNHNNANQLVTEDPCAHLAAFVLGSTLNDQIKKIVKVFGLFFSLFEI